MPHVDRHLHDHRARSPGSQSMERAPHDVTRLLRFADELAPLDDGFPASHSTKVGSNMHRLQRITARQYQDRYVVSVGLGEAADRVLCTGLATA